MKLNIYTTILLALISLFLTMSIVSAKVVDPEAVYEGKIKYECHGNIVTAYNLDTKNIIWECKVYDSIEPGICDPSLEKDVQWNIIIKIEIHGGFLHLTDKNKNKYIINKITGKKISQ